LTPAGAVTANRNFARRLLNDVYEFTVNWGVIYLQAYSARRAPQIGNWSHRHVEADPQVSEERVRCRPAVEHGLITSGISVAVIPSATGVRNKLTSVFPQIQTAL
jgi:hypothetical protein